jgi:predicted MFS family arabinose efflux permease
MGESGYRWVVLAVGTAAQAATAASFLGLASVSPALRDHFGLSLAGVGALLGAVSVGLVATLIPWGSAADRYGERGVMAVGLVGSAGALGVAALLREPLAVGALLLLSGASGASVNAASGRAVLTWFPSRRRGLAMAVRQTSVPVGAAVAAVALPAVAAAGGVPAVFLALAGTALAAAVAVAVWVREPPGHARAGARPVAGLRTVLGDRRLLRLSVAGLLLVVPQFLGSVFLVEVLHDGAGLALGTAAALLAATQLLGAAGRLGVGLWSDRARSRLGPLRVTAITIVVGFGLSAAVEPGPAALLAAVLVPAAALALCWNGLVFTAAGELAPPGRAATAMALSNTANYVGAALTPALGGLVAESAGWPAVLVGGAAAALGALLVLHRLGEAPPPGVGQPVPRRTGTGSQGTVDSGH